MDRISRLPDDILILVLSSLLTRDAVKTSILSKRWKDLWKSTSNLTFDYENMLGCSFSYKFISMPSFSQRITKFVRAVDKVLWNHSTSTIRKVYISFYLKEPFEHDLDRWIRSIIASGIEYLSLHMIDAFINRYVFPHRFLTCRQASHLKHLHLRNCIIKLDHAVEGFNSITTIELKEVTLSEEDFTNLLSSCSKLEQLTVDHCESHLVNLKVSSLQLKYLSVYCLHPNLQSISVFATNLISFTYVGPTVAFSFFDAPQSLQFSLKLSSFLDLEDSNSVTFGLESLVSNLPQLKSLCLFHKLSGRRRVVPRYVQTNNLNHLELYITHSTRSYLLWIAPLLKACPVLQKLDVNFCTDEVYDPSKKIRRPKKCRHSHLKKVEISGFFGLQNQMEIAAFILNNAVGLELMVISNNRKYHVLVEPYDCKLASEWRRIRPYVEEQLGKEACNGTKLVIS